MPSISKQSLVVLQGSRSNSCGATSPAMPLPASRTTLNGLMIDGSMNDITFSTYCGRMLRVRERAARGGRRRQAIAGDHVADVADAGVAAERQRAASRTILMPLYSPGLCDAVICAPPSSLSSTDAK